MRRHRAEACDRLALADVRPLVEPGAAAAALPDGTALAPRRPDAPRISHHRQQALIHRLDALESLRVLAIIPSVDAFIKTQGLALEPPPAGMGTRATETVHATGWAVRRGARDPRSSRGAPTDGITQKPLYD